ncbi:hypothetical protein NDU88_005077, partial [Pleurodeles waltl]
CGSELFPFFTFEVGPGTGSSEYCEVEEDGKWKCFSYMQGHWNYMAGKDKII